LKYHDFLGTNDIFLMKFDVWFKHQLIRELISSSISRWFNWSQSKTLYKL